MKFAVVAAFALSAVATGAVAGDRTVDFYMTHAKARSETLAKCRKDPGGVGHSVDCIRADAADFRLKNSQKGSGAYRKPGGGRYSGKTY